MTRHVNQSSGIGDILCSLDGCINALFDDTQWTFLVGVESPCQDLVSFYSVSLGWEEQESSIYKDGRVKIGREKEIVR